LAENRYETEKWAFPYCEMLVFLYGIKEVSSVTTLIKTAVRRPSKDR